MSGEIERLLPRDVAGCSSTAHGPTFRRNLECKVCGNSFAHDGNRTPRLLECGHTLCHGCLTRLVISGNTDVSCPFDRSITSLSNGGISMLRKNYALLEILDGNNADQLASGQLAEGDAEGLGRYLAVAGSAPLLPPVTGPNVRAPVSSVDFDREREYGVLCDEDERHVAVIYCTVCESNLCSDCSILTHNQEFSKVLAKHKRVPISEKPQRKLKCPFHSAYALEFVCVSPSCTAESPLMCILCRDYGRHVKHPHALLDSEVNAFRNTLVGSLDCLRQFQCEILEESTELRSAISAIQGTEEAHGSACLARQQAREHFANIREELARQESSAMSVIDAHVRERTGAIEQRLEDLSSLASQIGAVSIQLEKTSAQEDSKLMMARRDIQNLIDSVEMQHNQFSDTSSQLSLETLIPISFTKDNRVHIGPTIEMRVVSLGLDGCGKTTILFKLKQNEVIPSVPTIGFNVEAIEYKNLRLTIWDVGGVPKLRPLWKHYYLNTQAIIFVVDSTDEERLPEAQGELVKLLSERELRDAALLLFANKQDVEGALGTEELVERLALSKLAYGRSWHMQSCSTQDGRGLWEGIDWLSRQLISVNTTPIHTHLGH